MSYTPKDPTGSGVFDAFLRVGNGKEPCIAGYNTDATGKDLQWDTKGGAHTHAILLSAVPLELIGGVWYREFQLDINQVAGYPTGYLSIDELELWMTEYPALTGYPFAGQAVKVWELDNDPDNYDNYLKLDYNLDNGSGKRDLKVWIPNSVFAGHEDDYVVLFAEHGMDPAGIYPSTSGAWHNNDGYEEWGVALYKTFPNTLVNISACATEVYSGQSVDLYVSETNTGNDPITNVSVTVNDGSNNIAVLDKNGNPTLGVGETWNWTIYGVIVNVTTTFTATGTGTDSVGDPVTWPDYPDEQASVTVNVIPPCN